MPARLSLSCHNTAVLTQSGHRTSDHAYQAGPVITGDWYIPGTTSELEYRFGVVLGPNAAAPRRTWLAQLEYEFF